MTGARNVAPDAFTGTAQAYLRGRPPYPAALLAALADAAAPQPPSALLDLACGPGRLALDLAGAFQHVVANDLEAEMVDAGRQEAGRRGIRNVAWIVGPAENLEQPSGAFDLVTVGEAFHRLDQPVVGAKALAWLKPGGCFAAVGADGPLVGAEPWQVAAGEVADRWMKRAFPQGWAAGRQGAATSADGFEAVLRAAGFVDVGRRNFTQALSWTPDGVLNYFQSTSVCSRKALGEHAPAFERELSAVLAHHAADGALREEAGFGFILGRKPPG